MSESATHAAGIGAGRPLALWLYAAMLLTLLLQVGWCGLPFHYPHGWHAADQAVMARNFAREGVQALRGVPLRNNPPVGAEPDVYIHWPSAAPILLSVVFRLVGASEAVYHGWSAALLVVFCATLHAVLRERYSRRVAGIAVFAVLVMPVTAGYAHALGNTWLTLSLELLSLLAFVRATSGTRVQPGWALLGGAGVAAGVATSWFAIMLPPALLAAACCRRDRRQIRLALAYGAVAAATAAGVLGLFLSAAPQLAENLWRTLLYRMNLTDFATTQLHVHTVVDQTQFTNGMSAGRAVARGYENAVAMLGALPMLAMATVVAAGWVWRRQVAEDPAYVLFAGLYLPWLGWAAAMPQHMAHHDIAMQLLVPTAAAAFGLCGDAVLDLVARVPDGGVPRVARAVVTVIAPMMMLLPLLQAVGAVTLGTGAATDAATVAYATDIRSATPPNAIVIVPMPSMVPVYYAERHLIRGVQDPDTLRWVNDRLPALFPGAPVYLALPPEGASPPALRHVGDEFPLVRATAALRLYEIGPRGDADEAPASHTGRVPP